MKTTCSRNGVSFTTTAQGAELKSLTYQGLEYLWQADPHYWKRSAPVLFPFVGKLRNDTANTKAGTVHYTQHGFARDSEFKLIDCSPHSVTYELCSSEQTLKVYPYQFCLQITYCLVQDTTLRTAFRVTNTDTQSIYFGFGGHPAFYAPLEAHKTYSDYRLYFEEECSFTCPYINTATAEVCMTKLHTVSLPTNELTLSKKLFENDTIILKNVPNHTLVYADSQRCHGLQFTYSGFDYLALWSGNNTAPFIAIEPWCGMSTCDDEDTIFEHKRGIKTLEIGQSYTAYYDVTLF